MESEESPFILVNNDPIRRAQTIVMGNQEILILANPQGNAWDFAHRVYQKLNSNQKRERKYQIGEIEIKKFNDGEIFIKINANSRKKTCYFS